MYLDITLGAYIIDKIFGEFKYIKHPVIIMGEYIKYFENKFYKDDVFRGAILTFTLLLIVVMITFILSFSPWYIKVFIASTGIASKMLYDSVRDTIKNIKNIKNLVSRDTKNLNPSDINKALIETYGENFNDAIIAPLFYLYLFGIIGLFLYKAVNTLDSMVGYRTKKYEKYGKFSAILDDILNYLPSRITAYTITTLMLSTKAYSNIKNYAKLHDSPNAGYPISAIAGVCNISLGGNTSYNGKMKYKAYFGDGKKIINTQDVLKALSFHIRFDIFILLLLLSQYVKIMYLN
jgi:adenosylcobinamide-phosphate synthase